jgi:hypothetical protein
MKPTVLPTLAGETTKDIVEVLKRMLARAERGDFLDLAIVAREVGDVVAVERVSGEPMMLVACLERVKHEILSELEMAR